MLGNVQLGQLIKMPSLHYWDSIPTSLLKWRGKGYGCRCRSITETADVLLRYLRAFGYDDLGPAKHATDTTGSQLRVN